MRILIALVIAVVATSPIKAQTRLPDLQTGNGLVQGFLNCDRWRAAEIKTGVYMYTEIEACGMVQGYVEGTIGVGLVFQGKAFNIPNGVTNTQYYAVVRKYLNQHPEKLNEFSCVLILNALREAWPVQQQ